MARNDFEDGVADDVFETEYDYLLDPLLPGQARCGFQGCDLAYYPSESDARCPSYWCSDYCQRRSFEE